MQRAARVVRHICGQYGICLRVDGRIAGGGSDCVAAGKRPTVTSEGRHQAPDGVPSQVFSLHM
jgi:hypothetical protein